MKKIIYIITFIFISFAVVGQTFQILDANNSDVTNGTIQVTGEINDIIKAQIFVFNAGASTASFKVKKVETNVLPGTMNTFCFNGQCYPPNLYETPGAILLATGDTSQAQDFYGEYSPNEVVGTSIVTYVIFNEANPNDSVYVEVSYISTTTSIKPFVSKKIEFSNPFPNPATTYTMFNYNIPFDFNKASLEFRNLIGTVVKEVSIVEKNGKLTIELNDITEGIYFYTLVIDNKVILSRKMIKN